MDVGFSVTQSCPPKSNSREMASSLSNSQLSLSPPPWRRKGLGREHDAPIAQMRVGADYI